MAKNNYYAVKVGRETGIFRTWAECQAQVKGFSGAVYKGFQNMADAEEYLKEGNEKKEEDMDTPTGKYDAVIFATYEYLPGKDKGHDGTLTFGIVADTRMGRITLSRERQISLKSNIHARVKMLDDTIDFFMHFPSCKSMQINFEDSYGSRDSLGDDNYNGIRQTGFLHHEMPDDIHADFYMQRLNEARRNGREIDFYRVLTGCNDAYAKQMEFAKGLVMAANNS